MLTTHNLDFWVDFLKTNLKRNPYHAGDFKKKLTEKQFNTWFNEFFEQAKSNLDTGTSRGNKLPSGLTSFKMKPFRGEALFMYGALGNHYGQGAASSYPYFSWHFVSIYYDTKESNILIGVELKSLKASGIKPEELGEYYVKNFDNKDRYVVIYHKQSITEAPDNLEELYEAFINICEKTLLLVNSRY